MLRPSLADSLPITKSRSWLTTAAAMILAVVLALAGVLVGPKSADAAQLDIIVPGSITLTNESRGQGETTVQYDVLKVEFGFDTNGRVKAGDSFGVKVPAGFQLLDPTWDLTDDDGNVTASCGADGATGEVTCTFTDFAQQHFSKLEGKVFFYVQADEVTDTTTVEFGRVTGETEAVEIPGGGGIIGEQTEFPSEIEKWGWFALGSQDAIRWMVWIPEGTVDTTTELKITDSLGSGQTYNGVVMVEEVTKSPETYTELPTDAYTEDVSAGGTEFTITIKPNTLDPNKLYRIYYEAKIDDVSDPGPYTNTAVVAGTEVTDDATRHWEAGGKVIPTGFGRVGIQKLVSGDGAESVPADTVFTARAQWDSTVSGEVVHNDEQVQIKADGTLVPLKNSLDSEDLTTGVVITLSELTPPAVAGITWGTPKFTELPGVKVSADGQSAEVTVLEGQRVKVQIENTATKVPVATPPVTPTPSATPTPTVPETTPETTAPETVPPTTPETTAPAASESEAPGKTASNEPSQSDQPPVLDAANTPEALAETGNNVNGWLLGGAAAVLILGGALLALRRKRNNDEI
ncbi:Ig-like domain-containing protein [Gulosibacter bifidus]|uniref:Ig-like domain-containing protein n=1 Tax=Gulosibacter bifidus TaxID=272239 RepID=A0ABW5RK39_9MICO|nr:Ig-like domain-containing protein [Gulosibacter bifidus]